MVLVIRCSHRAKKVNMLIRRSRQNNRKNSKIVDIDVGMNTFLCFALFFEGVGVGRR